MSGDLIWRVVRHPFAEVWSVEVTPEDVLTLDGLRFVGHNGLLSRWPWYFASRAEAEEKVAVAQLLGWEREATA